MQLADRTAVVTGAGSGIGRAIAYRFAAEGAYVVVADINDTAGMETVAAIEAEGGIGRYMNTDVTNSIEVEGMVSQTLDAYGNVDILVNNAYFCDGGDILTVDEELWNRNIRGCLSSAFLCCKAVLPHMIDQEKGAIVNIASVNGLLGLGEEGEEAVLAGGQALVPEEEVGVGAEARALVRPEPPHGRAGEQRPSIVLALAEEVAVSPDGPAVVDVDPGAAHIGAPVVRAAEVGGGFAPRAEGAILRLDSCGRQGPQEWRQEQQRDW